MNNRLSKRIIAGYKASIKYCNNVYPGIIDNLSETGVNILTDPLPSSVNFIPGDNTEIIFEAPSEMAFSINCIIKWCRNTPPHELRYRLGLEIIHPPWNQIAEFL